MSYENAQPVATIMEAASSYNFPGLFNDDENFVPGHNARIRNRSGVEGSSMRPAGRVGERHGLVKSLAFAKAKFEFRLALRLQDFEASRLKSTLCGAVCHED